MTNDFDRFDNEGGPDGPPFASHPTCERCRRPILPGQRVTPVGKSVEEMVAERILLADELILVHADPQDCKSEEVA